MNTPRRSSLLVALVALVALTLAGCGGGGGSKNSDSKSGPTISTQPVSASVAVGGTATFTVAATGSGALAYRWYKGSTALDVTGPTLNLPSVTAESAGTYFCRVTDDDGSKDSAQATLTVGAAGSPTITTQPKSLAVAAGGEATFAVVATGDALAYQWLRNGTAIDGATEATYTIPAVTSSSAGSYAVRITNGAGTVTSAAATLTLASANAPVITRQPRGLTVGTGDRATFAVTASGTGLGYQWLKDGIAIPGATGSAYTVASATAASAGDYSVVVTNGNGSATSATATLAVATAPTITQQPAPQAAYVGKAATFTVAATGSDLRYQWYRSGAAIPGATGSSYTTPAVTVNDASATFSVVVSNAAGSVRSNGAALTVYDIPAITTPPKDATAGVGQTATFTVVANGVGGLEYQWTRNGAPIPSAIGATYVTPALALTDSGVVYAVRVTNPAGTRTSAEATLTVVPAPTLTGPTAATVTAPDPATFTVAATASAGALTYQWYRDGAKIAGATEATYTTGATTVAGDNGATFYVVVTNSDVISKTSATVTLTVR